MGNSESKFVPILSGNSVSANVDGHRITGNCTKIIGVCTPRVARATPTPAYTHAHHFAHTAPRTHTHIAHPQHTHIGTTC